MARKTKPAESFTTGTERIANVMPMVNGRTLIATIAEGWRATQADPDRLLLVHPDHPPRVIEMRSIKEGDILPRDIDMVLAPPPAVGGF